jgi:hypothetical protein
MNKALFTFCLGSNGMPQNLDTTVERTMNGKESGDVRKSEVPAGTVGIQMPWEGSIPSAVHPNPRSLWNSGQLSTLSM